jgi:protein-S-isoprenylcysteine O-methyltransferase Ste14
MTREVRDSFAAAFSGERNVCSALATDLIGPYWAVGPYWPWIHSNLTALGSFGAATGCTSMTPPGTPESRPRNRIDMPRWVAVLLALFVWLIAIPLAHGVVPWAISTLTRHYGWSDNSPGIWNWLGLIPITIAAALLIWVLILGIAQTPDRVKLGLTPSFLMLRGPYRFTRNPMYVAELGLWLGWALFFGSPGVFLGCLVFFPVVNWVILPREERGLEAAFGPAYSRYKDRVPRWLGQIKQ